MPGWQVDSSSALMTSSSLPLSEALVSLFLSLNAALLLSLPSELLLLTPVAAAAAGLVVVVCLPAVLRCCLWLVGLLAMRTTAAAGAAALPPAVDAAGGGLQITRPMAPASPARVQKGRRQPH